MKRLIVFATVIVVVLAGLLIVSGAGERVGASIVQFFTDDPDMPSKFKRIKDDMGKETFMEKRAEAIALRRGLGGDEPVDPQLRIAAIAQLEQQQQREARARSEAALATWTEIGPNPIPNAQVGTPPSTTASGRTIAIAVHPTNPDIVYVGTAQGGLYRSTNGGTNWTRLMDNALSLAIGAIAIAPSQPDTIYVGTGEANFSADSFFGVGVYRIDNASTAAPTLTGPLNKDAVNADIFTGRAIARILVHPSDPNTIFVATASGYGGIGGVLNTVLPSRGIYRSTNATTVNPTFAKLTGLAGNLNASVRDIAFDPLNPNLLVAGLVASAGTGGIYVSTNALGSAPTFTQRVMFNGSSTSERTAELAVQHSVGTTNPTFYAAVGDTSGGLYVNTDGGTAWTVQNTINFCSPQCFYDIAIDVDPTNAANVYLGGSPALVFGRSANNGTTFTANGTNFTAGLHVDSHAIAVAPSNPQVVYFGSDGGIYRTSNVTATPIVWTSLNNSEFTATQFMGLAVHPTDPNFTIGGTQDNGTNFYRANATWTRADFGDGGFAAIDQNAADTTNVTMYHTYFNQTNNLIGFARVSATTCATEGNWAFKGVGAIPFTNACGDVEGVNGIIATDPVLFYAPLELGPGNPNTVYFGTVRLYRSTNRGDVMTPVSQALAAPISAIGISPQNDNVRLVGTAAGGIFGTTTAADPLVDLDAGGTIPDGYVGRAVIDPSNPNTAYVALAVFGQASVWKTVNLNTATPTWTAMSTGLPQAPVSAFVVDPLDSAKLYAGTDIGVYSSANGGTTWVPFGTGLPRVAVFDMAITAGRQLRIATHGRGMWQIPVSTLTSSTVTVSGRVLSSGGRGLTNARVSISGPDGESRTTLTSRRGHFAFNDVAAGATYVVSVGSRRFQFEPQTITVNDSITDLTFVPQRGARAYLRTRR